MFDDRVIRLANHGLGVCRSRSFRSEDHQVFIGTNGMETLTQHVAVAVVTDDAQAHDMGTECCEIGRHRARSPGCARLVRHLVRHQSCFDREFGAGRIYP